MAAILAVSGCKSQQAGSLQPAVDDFNHQRYAQAHEKAVKVEGHALAGQREDAAYLAGLSAYQLGRTDEAQRQLVVACGSTDPQTAAKAKAMLGQVRLDQHRPREAAALLSAAAPALDGEDGRKAAYNAAIAYQQAGDMAAARTWLAVSKGQAASPMIASSGSARAAGSGSKPSWVGGVSFTLQVGAFSEKNRAQKAADEATKLAQRDGLGQVQIVPRRDDRGKPMFLVQVGRFPSRDAAAAARAKLGRLDYIVAPFSAASS